ncbi:MAG: hypothetical protein H6744_19625 [Deltaproteobacteria bacterium]|nr:hypothetical protein [Deltaproteobacteria bacterium]MCB9788892.1 hypothetical protein [Deltaproteobacteria bacterium]
MTRLRSEERRLAVAAQVSWRLADADSDTGQQVRRVLGEVALSLACRPRSAWAGTVDELTAIAGPELLPGESRAAIELGCEAGLLEEFEPGRLRFADTDTLLWLAARRTASTGDARELGQYRLRGALFDVFAMAVAEVGDPAGIPLVRDLAATGEGGVDLLDLAALQAAAACAWGAAADLELRADLLARAALWTGGSGLPFQREVGAALLAAEAGAEPFGARVRADLLDWIEATAHDLSHPGLSSHPVLLEMLEAHLMALVAGETADPPRWAELAIWLGSLAPVAYRAVCATTEPWMARNEVLLRVAREQGLGSQPRALSLLAAVSSRRGDVQALVRDVLSHALGAEDRLATERAVVVAEAVADWEELPGPVADALGELMVGEVTPAVRLAVAAPLAAHPDALAERRLSIVGILHRGIEEEDPIARAGIVGAALSLGSVWPDLAAMTVDLFADGVAADALPKALAAALCHHPAPVAGLAELLALHDSPLVRTALIGLLEASEAQLIDGVSQGVHRRAPQPAQVTREALVRLLQPLAFDLHMPELAARAATLMGWFGRGDAAMAQRLFDVRAPMHPGPARDGFGLALGAVGCVQSAIVEDLARDLAVGPPASVTAAAQALRWLVQDASSAALVERWVSPALARAGREPHCRLALMRLARHIAMAPLTDGATTPPAATDRLSPLGTLASASLVARASAAPRAPEPDHALPRGPAH